MILNVANDLHLGSTIACCTYQDLLSFIYDNNNKVILNGDIIDMAYCPKKDVSLWGQRMLFVRNLVEAREGHYIEGNHSLRGTNLPEKVYVDDDRTILCCHSHRWSWTENHVKDFMSQSPGAGWFKRSILVRLVNDLRRLLAVRPNQLLLDHIAAEKVLNPNLKVCIFGHSHPPEDVHFEHMGVKCVILSRGFHTVDTDKI